MSELRSTLLLVVALPVKAAVFLVSLLFPRDDRLWVFMAGDGDRFADNAKYLFVHCADRDDVRNVWVGTNDEVIEQLRAAGYEAYSTRSWRGRSVMLRAGVFFETHGPIAPEYTGRARVIHLTHGNYLKTMLADHTRDWPWPVELAVELFFERRRRFVVTGAGPPAANMQSMRGISRDRLLVTGFPRNDVLLSNLPDARLGVDESALDAVTAAAREGPVLIFAPTYRTGYGECNGVPMHDLSFGFDDLERVLAERDATLYLSLHPDATFDTDLSPYEHVHRLDTGGDLYPFLTHADALVTDYSGIFYDYLLLDRPIVFYAPDLEAYTRDRALYFDYEDHVPGPIARDPDDFADAIRAVLDGEDDHASDRAHVREAFYDQPDGNASERVYRAVLEDLS